MRIIIEGRSIGDRDEIEWHLRDRLQRALRGAARDLGTVLVRIELVYDGRFVRRCVILTADHRVAETAEDVLGAIDRAVGRLGAVHRRSRPVWDESPHVGRRDACGGIP